MKFNIIISICMNIIFLIRMTNAMGNCTSGQKDDEEEHSNTTSPTLEAETTTTLDPSSDIPSTSSANDTPSTSYDDDNRLYGFRPSLPPIHEDQSESSSSRPSVENRRLPPSSPADSAVGYYERAPGSPVHHEAAGSSVHHEDSAPGSPVGDEDLAAGSPILHEDDDDGPPVYHGDNDNEVHIANPPPTPAIGSPVHHGGRAQ